MQWRAKRALLAFTVLLLGQMPWIVFSMGMQSAGWGNFSAHTLLLVFWMGLPLLAVGAFDLQMR